MTSEILYLGNLRTEAIHVKSSNALITDAPTDNNGKGEAFSPTDLLATSLASCIVTVMGIEAEACGYDLKGTKATLIKTMGSGPRRVVKIEVGIILPLYTKDEKELKRLERIGLNCPVAKSLHPDILQEVSFKYLK